MLKRSIIEDLITDARAIGEIVFAAITVGALSEATVKLIEAGPLVEAAIGVLAPAIVILRAAERTLEMWRKYRRLVNLATARLTNRRVAPSSAANETQGISTLPPEQSSPASTTASRRLLAGYDRSASPPPARAY